ncbi:phospholipase D-like domain-containing protein [Micromonospora zamorensis]|uniref:phospholipase D-like domain-containing protein n=1 Tax=Micromonospora zamorensis TaxID=709883 RepID=UPI003D96A7CC
MSSLSAPAHTLASLKDRYLGSARTYDDVTGIDFLIDGDGYFRTLDEEIRATEAGDRVYVLDWFHKPHFDLLGRTPEDPGYAPIGQLLAERANAGVDVRVVLTGSRYWTLTTYAPFLNDFQAFETLRSQAPAGAKTPPLANRVLFDWSGAVVTGTHHQKAVVLVRQGRLSAFLGGIGINDAAMDSAPHNSRQVPKAGIQWGWHDAAVRLDEGAAVAVYDNFSQRWTEAMSMPPTTLRVRASLESLRPVQRVRYAPPTTLPPLPPAPPVRAAEGAMPATSVQVLRSRFPHKLNQPMRRRVPWTTEGGGGVFEIYDTLRTAIEGAHTYIYIEDQFMSDHPVIASDMKHKITYAIGDLLIDRRIPKFSLFPHLAAALRRGVRVIMVGSGFSDPWDVVPGEQNARLNVHLADLARVNPDALAVWRLREMTVHSKVMIVDDAFAAVGSANMQARSMMGVDSELHVALATQGSAVRDLRARLWAEHLAIDHDTAPSDVIDGLWDLDDALGMWRRSWSAGDRWFVADQPKGFTPAELQPGIPRQRVVRQYVGPGAAE